MQYLTVKKIVKEWKYEKNYLIDTCLLAQDQFKSYLDDRIY